VIKVLVADDHPVVRKGLKEILEEEADMKVADEARNAQEVLDLIRKHKYDVVVLDVDMPGRSGLDALKELKAQQPRLPVLMLSVHSEEQFAVRAIKTGAAGYLTKETAADELVKAVRKAFQGGKYICPSVAEMLVSEINGRGTKALHKVLSNREYDVLRMIAAGKTVSEIASEIALSVKTVSTYRARLLQKMGMKTNAELMHYAIKNNLA